jgi:hypothetical protein
VGLVEDLRERLLLTLKYLRLYGEITMEISRLNREISNVVSTNTVWLKMVPGTGGWLVHNMYPGDRLLGLPEWFKFLYGLYPDRDYVLHSIYLYYDHISVTFRDSHGGDIDKDIIIEWIDPYTLVFLSILRDEEWEELLDAAKRHNTELYGNMLVYHEAASMLKNIVYEPEPDIRMRSFDVERVVLDSRLVDDVVARAQKALGKPLSIVRDELTIFEDPYTDDAYYITIDMRLDLNKEVVLPREVAHVPVFLPSTSLTVNWVEAFHHVIHVWTSYDTRGGWMDRWTVIRGGKVNTASLLLASYMLSEETWKKIIDKLGYYLWLTEVVLRKFKRASIVLNLFR